MPLDPAKLENVEARDDGRSTARCPACAEAGGDHKGDHLVLYASGSFGCVVNPGPEGEEHRKRIFALAGARNPQARVAVRGPGSRKPAQPTAEPIDLLAFRTGRTPFSHFQLQSKNQYIYNRVKGITEGAIGDNGADTPSAPSGAVRPGLVQPTPSDPSGPSGLAPAPTQGPPTPTTAPAGAGAKSKSCGNASAPTDGPPPRLHTHPAALAAIAQELADAIRLALDIETYGSRKGDALDPGRGDIRLLTLCRHGGRVHTIDLQATGYDLRGLKPVLEGAEIVAHNARFDFGWVVAKCGLVIPKALCTLTAARLLAAGTKPGNNLDQCLQRYCGIEPGPDHSTSDWGSMVLTDDQLIYARRDVAHLHDLAGTLEHEIEMAGLAEVWRLETKLLPVVVAMEHAGIAVDQDKLATIATEARRREAGAVAALREALGNPRLNPGSPTQLLPALKAAGLDIDSTGEEALKAADDSRLVPLVLAVRGAAKEAQQAEALIEHIGPDGRIHAGFNPLGAATGRFSSSKPNMQNIGRGELRDAFRVPPGRKLVQADYSQIELRVAAALAGDSLMLDAYRSGADLHKRTAAAVLGKAESDVTREDRQLAKATNFGLIYGQSAPGLARYAQSAYGVAMTEEQAGVIRERFFNTYSGLARWHTEAWGQVRAGAGETRTRLGRRRLIPDDASDWVRFTTLVNSPVQGAAADGMKLAMVELAGRLPEGARIVSTVHDELLVECPEADAGAVLALTIGTMRGEMEKLFPEVPVEVEGRVCNSWAEK